MIGTFRVDHQMLRERKPGDFTLRRYNGVWSFDYPVPWEPCPFIFFRRGDDQETVVLGVKEDLRNAWREYVTGSGFAGDSKSYRKDCRDALLAAFEVVGMFEVVAHSNPARVSDALGDDWKIPKEDGNGNT